MSKASIHDALKLALASTSIKVNVSCHTLRHCYGTHLLEEGVCLRQLSQYMGHATLEQTMIYLHLTETTEARTHEALERLHAQVINPAQHGKRPTS